MVQGDFVKRVGLGLAVAAAVLLVLGIFVAADPTQIKDGLASLPVGTILVVLILTAANLWLSALKYRLLHPETPIRRDESFLATALGGLFGQVMPVQASVSLSRAIFAKFSGRQGVRSVGASLLEQFFDALVVFGALALFLGYVISGSAGALIAGALYALSVVLAARYRKGILGRLMRADGNLAFLGDLATAASGASAKTYRTLAGISIVKYWVVLGRALVVLFAAGVPIQLLDKVGFAFPVTHLVSVLPITPGALGALEWTWASVLGAAGFDLAAAAAIAILLRLVIVAAQIIIVALAAAVFLGNRRRLARV